MSAAFKQAGRMAGLDALRGIAALLVVIYHYTVRYQETIAPHNDAMWLSFPYPAIGVQIFFAISGFVIFMTLERCASGRDFFVSRFARLYPPFLFCMLLTALFIFSTGFNSRNIQVSDVFVNLIMAVGLVGGTTVDGSYWTLTCEISFYALIAVFFYQVQRRKVVDGRNFADLLRNPLVPAVLVWMVVTAVGRASVDELFAPLPLGLNFLYGHLFVAGIAVYGFSKGKLLVPAVLLGIATISSGFNADGHFVATACVKVLGIAALVWLGAHIRLNRWMASIAGFLGGISYSLYLIHQSVGYVLIYKMEEAGVGANLAVWATVLVMVVFAYLIRAYIEIPAQNWIGKKYAPWKTPRPALAAADPA